MIQNFFASWELFANTYLAGGLLAILLALVGVLIVARNQIFIGATISQSTTLGISLALWLPLLLGKEAHLFESGFFSSVVAVVFSVLASVLTLGRGRSGNDSDESIAGWLFLFSGSLAILIVAHSPHGLEEIHRLLSSSLIGASRADVWIFGGLAGLLALGFFFCSRPLLLLSIDSEMAEAVGLNVRLWSLGLAVVLGVAVGLAIRSAGMLYTFGCLVLPALAARHLCKELRQMLWVSPLIAGLASLLAFVLANEYDFPPAQMGVALLGLFFPMAWLYEKFVK